MSPFLRLRVAASVAFDGERWSDDISHGELLRSGLDQRLTTDD